MPLNCTLQNAKFCNVYFTTHTQKVENEYKFNKNMVCLSEGQNFVGKQGKAQDQSCLWRQT